MKLIKNFHNITKDEQNTVLTIGNFDGIHLGHQEILNNARRVAHENNAKENSENLKSALLTFEPHPLKIIKPEKICDQRLFSLSQKLSFLSTNNLVDIVFLAGFDKQMADLSAEDFVKKILVEKLKIKHLVIGYDFTFGKNRQGDATLLQKLGKTYNFSFHQIAAKNNSDAEIFSSSKIRKFISAGDIKSANSMLGRPYEINGIVIQGKNLARSIGFPTANFLPRLDLIKPKFGVYKVLAKVDNKEYKAVLNFGIKPTFDGNIPLYEVHIFDYNQDIYGKKITVKLLNFIRSEQKFNGIEELKEQIRKDVITAHE